MDEGRVVLGVSGQVPASYAQACPHRVGGKSVCSEGCGVTLYPPGKSLPVSPPLVRYQYITTRPATDPLRQHLLLFDQVRFFCRRCWGLAPRVLTVVPDRIGGTCAKGHPQVRRHRQAIR